jgi:hypothetical protein
MTRTPQDFIAAYEASLLQDVTNNPTKFSWKVAPGQTKADLVPEMSTKMIRGLFHGNVTINERVRSLAKEFGVKPTQRGIRAFLWSSGGSP